MMMNAATEYIQTGARLSTRSLTVGYKQEGNTLTLFENLNISLPPSQLVCFMGPNGIGKSTLIRTLAGLQKPLSGIVEITSDESAGSGRRTPHRLAVVLTDRITSGNMTVKELIAFGRYPYLEWHIRFSEEDRRLIDAAINNVNIGFLADKRLHELSDGQIQMAMIARALAQDTPIVLLDEPTAHLDLNNRVEIIKLLHSLTRKMKKTILISTHDLDLALQTADCIWLSGKGKNIIAGMPEDLVLDGSFDEIFQFKGFDLKTGKVQHEAYRHVAVELHGDGYPYLWTKNALERNGFHVTSSDGQHRVDVALDSGSVRWLIDGSGTYRSIADLLDRLK